MHRLVLFFLLGLVHVQFLTQQSVPVALQLGLRGFADHLALNLN